MQYLDYIFLFVHFVIFIVDLVVNSIHGRKISKLCDICKMPVYSGVEHNCQLTSEEVDLLTHFILSIKENK